MPVKAVLFDAYGTLLPDVPAPDFEIPNLTGLLALL